jgi:hypothetical protein
MRLPQKVAQSAAEMSMSDSIQTAVIGCGY